MLIDQLRDDQTAVDDARHALRDRLTDRDRTVQELRALRVPVTTIGKITGLSPQRIAVIQSKRLDGSSPTDLDGTVTS